MHRYKSLDVWKRAHDSALLALRITDQSYHPKSRSLFDQIRRAAVSIEANVVERELERALDRALSTIHGLLKARRGGASRV